MGIIVLLIVIGGSIGALVFSATKNIQAMSAKNILILLVDETNGNEVELGFGILTGGEPFLIEARTKIQGHALRDIFSSGSFESNCELLLGQGISGVYLERDGEVPQGGERFQLVITIPTSFFGELTSLVGKMDFKFGAGGELHVTRRLTANDMVMVLRSDAFSGMGIWRLDFVDPRTGRSFTREIDGEEYLNLLLFAPLIEDEEQALTLNKFISISGLQGAVSEKSKTDPAITGKVVESLMDNYKKGAIKVYPSNTVTRLVKYLPLAIPMAILNSES